MLRTRGAITDTRSGFLSVRSTGYIDPWAMGVIGISLVSIIPAPVKPFVVHIASAVTNYSRLPCPCHTPTCRQPATRQLN